MEIKYYKNQSLYFVKNESLSEISNKIQISEFAIKKANNVDSVSFGDILIIPNYNVYVVKPLDTIRSISKKFGVDENYLKQINNSSKFFVGEMIIY